MGILVDDLEESEIEKKGKKRGKSGGGLRGGIWRGEHLSTSKYRN